MMHGQKNIKLPSTVIHHGHYCTSVCTYTYFRTPTLITASLQLDSQVEIQISLTHIQALSKRTSAILTNCNIRLEVTCVESLVCN
jgi:hypothetical protein